MSTTPSLTPFCEGGCYFECPRWHEGRWWASDLYRCGVFTYDSHGRERKLDVEAQPSGLGWLPNGDLLVVSMKDRRVLRCAADGSIRTHSDLPQLATGHLNDMVVGTDPPSPFELQDVGGRGRRRPVSGCARRTSGRKMDAKPKPRPGPPRQIP